MDSLGGRFFVGIASCTGGGDGGTVSRQQSVRQAIPPPIAVAECSALTLGLIPNQPHSKYDCSDGLWTKVSKWSVDAWA